MTHAELQAALNAVRAYLPTPQGDDELSLAEAAEALGTKDLKTAMRALTAAGWTYRENVKFRNGHVGRSWCPPTANPPA